MPLETARFAAAGYPDTPETIAARPVATAADEGSDAPARARSMTGSAVETGPGRDCVCNSFCAARAAGCHVGGAAKRHRPPTDRDGRLTIGPAALPPQASRGDGDRTDRGDAERPYPGAVAGRTAPQLSAAATTEARGARRAGHPLSFVSRTKMGLIVRTSRLPRFGPQIVLTASANVAKNGASTAQTAAEPITGTGRRPDAAIGMRRDQFGGAWMDVPDEMASDLCTACCHRALLADLDGLPVGGACVLPRDLTAPLRYDAIEKRFRTWRGSLGEKARPQSLHGFRRLAIIHPAEAGCADAEIRAVTHRSAETVACFRRRADRRKLSRAARERNGNETSLWEWGVGIAYVCRDHRFPHRGVSS